jgi:hypothetical protein
MSVKLKTPSNGSVTLAPEDTASDVTLTVPAVAGEILNDASNLAAAKLTGNVAAARITDALNASGSAPIYACRAWVNFDGSPTTPSIRGSGNVSSVTRNGTGDYTLNFTAAMPDANYCPVFGSEGGFDVNRYQSSGTRNTGNYQVRTGFQGTTGALTQANIGTVLVCIFR